MGVCSGLAPCQLCSMGWGLGLLCMRWGGGVPPLGIAQVPVPFLPSSPSSPQAQLGQALPLGPQCPYFPATALLGLSLVFP